MRISTSLAGKLAAALALLLAVCAPALAAGDWKADLTDQINRYRRAAKCQPLATDPALDRLCEEWAATIATGKLRHRKGLGKLLKPNGWDAICENLYRGNPLDPATILAAWIASPPHRENLLRPEIHLIGLGSAQPENTPPTVVFMGGSVNNFVTPSKPAY